jgi:hypothetical protein
MPGQMDDAEREQLYTRFSENKKIPSLKTTPGV